MIRNTKGKFQRIKKYCFEKSDKFWNQGVEQASNTIDRVNKRHICIGITGLSQSGKSTFLTSLIDQLLHHKTSSIPGFSSILGKRLMGVKLSPLRNKNVSNFPYEESIAGLRNNPPKWPNSTTDISGCVLELKVQKAKTTLIPFSKENYSLFIEIIDYPGEWLLDLPLRDMDFARWCAQCSAQFNRDPRRQILGELLPELQNIDPMADADFEVLEGLKRQFVGFLKQCKEGDEPLSLIQPGRFLVPGQVDDESVLCFVPLLKVGAFTDGQLKAAPKNSYFKVCETRYKAYIKQLVEPFYRDFFSGIDRQIVLVDVLTALNSGALYLDDMRQALSNISDSFSYGSQNRISQLFTPKIDRVVFAATKADQILTKDHLSLVKLLSSLVEQAYETAEYEGVIPEILAVAGVRSSKEVPHDGEPGLSGFDTAGNYIGYVNPSIPTFIPKNAQHQFFSGWKIPKFNPPIPSDENEAVPHIRIDNVLKILVGDKCL
ncbi:YcjX family protein [Oceanospirillaceae bacterium]|nr:YcjX family protein [Oceanospirillaceae bacterium]